MKRSMIAVISMAAGMSAMTLTDRSAAAGIVSSDVTWSVAYGASSPSPADNRGLAVDLTGQYLYLGYNNIGVRKVSLATGSVVASSPTQRGKSIAVDDQGRVYTTGVNGESIFVYDSDLNLQSGVWRFCDEGLLRFAVAGRVIHPVAA